MRKILSIAIILIFISVCVFAQTNRNYNGYVRRIESTWDEYSEAKEFEKFQQEQSAAYQAFLQEQEEAYRNFVEEVEKKWNEFIDSTPAQFVDYSEDKSIRTIINFEAIEEEIPAKPEKTIKEPVKEIQKVPTKEGIKELEERPEKQIEEKPEKDQPKKPVESVEKELVEQIAEETEEKPAEIIAEEPKEIESKKPEKIVREKPEAVQPEKPEETQPARKPAQLALKEREKKQEKTQLERTKEEPERIVEERPEETKPQKPKDLTAKKPFEELAGENPAIAVSEKPMQDKPEISKEQMAKMQAEEAITSVRPEEVVEKPATDGKGQIVVEAVVPADDPVAIDEAKKKIATHIEKIFSKKNDAGANILEDQVQTASGETVTPENAKKFAEEEILPKATVSPKVIKSKDGVKRVKVSVAIPMMPKHLETRAKQYRGLVKKYTRRYKEDIPLVMAIIQTESYFNPLAKSHIPAYGLMQLVPKTGGRDAYKFVHKKDEAPSPKYLYVPENNLMLGIAYVHILRDKYFYGIEDPLKQEYLIAASYNAGMGRVIRRVLKKYNVPEMSPDEVYDVLREVMPDETKDYLAKVSSRKKNYLAWQ